MLTPGLPPPGTLGEFIGYDAAGQAFVLRWHSPGTRPAWYGVGWQCHGSKVLPVVHCMIEENADMIKYHRSAQIIELRHADKPDPKIRPVVLFIAAVACLIAMILIGAKLISGAHAAEESLFGTSRLTFKRAYTLSKAHLRVVDGDTFEYRGTKYRAIGYDAPELHVSCEADRGAEAKRWLDSMIAEAPAVRMKAARQKDKYGRGLAYLYVANKSYTGKAGWTEVGSVLIANGLAHPYDGRGPRPPWPGC